MLEHIPVLLVKSDASSLQPLVNDLMKERLVAKVADNLKAAMPVARAAKSRVIVYFETGKENPEDLALMLRKLKRDFASALIFVVAGSARAHIKRLLIDDSVEGVFHHEPVAQHLNAVVRRSLSVRVDQKPRGTPRYPAKMECIVKVVGVPGGVEGEVRQIGSGGFKAVLKNAPYQNLQNPEVRFALFNKNSKEPMCIEGAGEIRWTESAEVGTSGVELGIQFKTLGAAAEDHLFGFINSIRTTVGAF